MGNLSIVGGNVVIDVKIAVMQDDHKSGYDCSMACPKCKGEVKRPQVCINPNCDQEIDDTQKSDHQNLRYFKDDPDKKMFTKKQIDEPRFCAPLIIIFEYNYVNNFFYENMP